MKCLKLPLGYKSTYDGREEGSELYRNANMCLYIQEVTNICSLF